MDIKKAWNTMKKELEKETGIAGGFTMSVKQIANRTATYLVCNNLSYEREIEYHRAEDERVQGFETWTDKEKERAHAREIETIERLERRLAEYGTKKNEANVAAEKIVKSKAFAKFQETVGSTVWVSVEETNDAFYVRFNY